MEWFRKFVDIGFSMGLFVNAILFVPQLIRLIKIKDAQSLSLIMFGGFSIIQFFMLLHGFLWRDYILALGTLPSLVLCFIIFLLILFYRIKSKQLCYKKRK